MIAASNRDLEKAVRENQFRQDLYYRLAIIAIFIPPLRERKEDVLPLVDFFIDRYNSRFKKSIRGIVDDTRRLLLSHTWPGNVRELKNTIERAMILEEGQFLRPLYLPFSVAETGGRTLFERTAAPENGQTLANGRMLPRLYIPEGGTSLEEVERTMVELALRQASGNQTQAAKLPTSAAMPCATSSRNSGSFMARTKRACRILRRTLPAPTEWTALVPGILPAVARASHARCGGRDARRDGGATQLVCYRFRRSSEALGRVADDDADNSSGQHNFKVVVVRARLHGRDSVGQYQPNTQAEDDAQRQRVHLACEITDEHTRDQSFDRGSHTIWKISGRAAGVNHDVNRSKMPGIPPRISPSTGFLMVFLQRESPLHIFYSANTEYPLARPKKNQQRPSHQVSQQQQNPYTVADHPAPGPRKRPFRIGTDGQSIDKMCDIRRQCLHGLVAHGPLLGQACL